MAVHQSEAVTDAQKNRVPVAVKKAVRSHATGVESVERDDYASRRGAVIKASYVFMQSLRRELEQELDNVNYGMASGHGHTVEICIRFD